MLKVVVLFSVKIIAFSFSVLVFISHVFFFLRDSTNVLCLVIKVGNISHTSRLLLTSQSTSVVSYVTFIHVGF